MPGPAAKQTVRRTWPRDGHGRILILCSWMTEAEGARAWAAGNWHARTTRLRASTIHVRGRPGAPRQQCGSRVAGGQMGGTGEWVRGTAGRESSRVREATRAGRSSRSAAALGNAAGAKSIWRPHTFRIHGGAVCRRPRNALEAITIRHPAGGEATVSMTRPGRRDGVTGHLVRASAARSGLGMNRSGARPNLPWGHGCLACGVQLRPRPDDFHMLGRAPPHSAGALQLRCPVISIGKAMRPTTDAERVWRPPAAARHV